MSTVIEFQPNREDERGAPETDADRATSISKWAKRQAIGQMHLSWGAREVGRILDAFREGQCFPSHWWVAERLHLSRSAVRRYLRKLKENGYIEITAQYERYDGTGPARRRGHTPRGQRSNSYTLFDQPDLIACARRILEEWRVKQQGPRV